MASHDRFSSVIKCGRTTFYSNVFAWNINVCTDAATVVSSNIFQFCGYCCYLYYEFESSPYYEKNIPAKIILHGYQAPYKKRISCRYSLILKSNQMTTPITETGEIQTTSEKIRISLYNGSQSYSKGTVTICFSWYEDGVGVVSSKGVQTEPERSTNVLERWTQTEDMQILPMKDNCTKSDRESDKFLEILSKELGSFYEGQTDYDCVLKVGETKFPVHRSVLAARSPVFAAMFHHDTSESKKGEVDIPDVDATALGDVLYYIYAGKFRGLSPDTATLMYAVADKYSLIDFRDKCLEFLIHNLTVENVCDAAVLSHVHAEEELEKKVVQFIKIRLQELMNSEKWKHFSIAHSLLANKLLCSALIACQTGKM